MTEKELIAGMKRETGGDVCFRELYESLYPPLYRFVYSCVKSADTAKDITHESLVKLWMHRETLDENRSVRAYLFTTCRNSLVKELRRQLRNPNVRDWVELSAAVSVESRISYDYDAYLKGLDAAKAKLSPRQKQIFRLNREEGLSAREISGQLGISEQVVRNQLSSALKKIRDYLLKYMPLLIVIFRLTLNTLNRS